jgi:glycolate oxidase
MKSPLGRWARRGLARDLTRLVDRDRVRTDPVDLRSYMSDATYYFARGLPDAVVLPETAAEVSAVLKYASRRVIPVTPRGAGSGLSAGCTPLDGGIVVDLKRMNRILDINRGNMIARVEAGVVLTHFHRAAEKLGLLYPPDPQSMDVCTIGGNVATRAGGPSGVKYGTTGNYVLGLEAVLPDGEIIATGGLCVKQSAGYDLTHLLTGSEGTLAVITRVNLRVLPLPAQRRTIIVVCNTVPDATHLVAEIIAAGATPAKLEFLMTGPILIINTFIAKPLPTSGGAYLFIELDGAAAAIAAEAAVIEELSRAAGAHEVRVVQDPAEADSYWQARKNLNPVTVAMFKRMINEDVAVPRDRVPELIAAIQKISADVGIPIGLGGHAGDGNIHPALLLTRLGPDIEAKAARMIELIIKAGLELGGTISGEHGVGSHKSAFLAWELGQPQIELMKRIKRAFDPQGIMNPGKIWPREES